MLVTLPPSLEIRRSVPQSPRAASDPVQLGSPEGANFDLSGPEAHWDALQTGVAPPSCSLRGSRARIRPGSFMHRLGCFHSPAQGRTEIAVEYPDRGKTSPSHQTRWFLSLFCLFAVYPSGSRCQPRKTGRDLRKPVFHNDFVVPKGTSSARSVQNRPRPRSRWRIQPRRRDPACRCRPRMHPISDEAGHRTMDPQGSAHPARCRPIAPQCAVRRRRDPPSEYEKSPNATAPDRAINGNSTPRSR